MKKILFAGLIAMAVGVTAFGQDAFKKLSDEARTFERERKYAEASAKYAEAAELAGTNVVRKAGFLNDQFHMLNKAGKYREAVDVALLSMKIRPDVSDKLDWRLNELTRNLVQKKDYAAVTNFVNGVAALPSVSPAIQFAADRIWAQSLAALGDKTAARTQFMKLIEGGAPLLDLLYDLRKSYGGREEREGFKVAAAEFKKRGKDLEDKYKVRFWDDFGYDAYLALYYDGMKMATEELEKLGRPGFKYGLRVPRAMEAFEEIATFPKKESEIHFPKSITDFGVNMTNGTVYVARDFGFNEKDSTEIIQKAFDSGASRIIVENTGKPWIIRMVYPRSNTEIILKKGVRFIAEPEWFKSRKHCDAMFKLSKVKNVMIRGENDNDHEVVISGYRDFLDRAKNCRNYGASAFEIVDSENVAIMNMRVHDTGMDGISLGGLGISNKDSYFKNLDLDSHFRQGCSICAAHGAYFKNVRFRNTAGAEPAAGVDLEPSELNQANWGLYFFDCTFEGNMGGGLLFSTSGYEPIGVYAKRCTFEPQRRADLTVFIRYGIYAGRNITVPGKAVFEDCTFRGFSDESPIVVEGLSLLDLHFKNCTVTDTGKFLTRGTTPDASPIKFHLNNDVWYSWNIPDDNKKATITFENFKVTGYTNAPPITFYDEAGHYSVRNIKGKIDFNGKIIDAAKFNYNAPDFKFKDLPKTVPAGLPIPSVMADNKSVDHPFTFRYDGYWWTPWHDYTYLFYGKKGESAEFLLRYGGWVPGDKTIRFIAPSGKKIEQGEFKAGDNSVSLTFPETGWYSFHPSARHVLVSYKGVNLCYYAGTGTEQKIQIDSPKGYVGYFEVPAKKDVTLKVYSGTLEIRNAQGELVATPKSNIRTGSGYATVKSASGKTEVWSFTVPEKTVFKFFSPATGIWADSPETVPVAAKDVVRSPVVKIDVSAKADASAEAQGMPLDDFLKANPAIARIVALEAEARLAWAKKGEWTKLYKEKKAFLDDFSKRIANEQQQKEFADDSKNLPPLKELADMESGIVKMSRTELERYAFANAFVILYGIYPNADVGGRFVRSLHDRTELASVDPEVYWWIYKADYENYIRYIVNEMQLGYRDFTLVCDDDKKLEKLLPTLQKFVSASIPEDLKN